MKNEYIEILNTYIFSIWKFLLFPIIIILSIAVFKFFCSKKKKIKNTIKDYLIIIFLFFGFITIGCIHTFPAIIDANQNSIENITFESAYYYNQSVLNDDAMLGTKPILVCKTDGTKIELQDSTFDFPFEIENGTIIYAKNSKIILEYSGNIINENHY